MEQPKIDLSDAALLRLAATLDANAIFTHHHTAAATLRAIVDARRASEDVGGLDLQIADNGHSVMLYTLKEERISNGKRVRVNDLMIRLENARGSTNDLQAIAARIRAALVQPAKENLND